ncbi:DUF2256 domain-containing protein [Roseivirga thermotolerans]|uniref:DUF2256 domain-containing protein n=2 Tax=Roseivirgaceae TaxID=2762306 RepID=UPI0035143E4E
MSSSIKLFYWDVVIPSMKKGQLPTKICPVCNRPFEWRKKWRNCWQEVVYCSEKCRRNRNRHAELVSASKL